jgi:hypothetical protein
MPLSSLFFVPVTDENSESDSDTEEKLKGEESRCMSWLGGEESRCVS